MAFEEFGDVLDIVNYGTDTQNDFAGMSDCAFAYVRDIKTEEMVEKLTAMLEFFRNTERVEPDKLGETYAKVDAMSEDMKEYYMRLLMDSEAIACFISLSKVYSDDLAEKIEKGKSALKAWKDVGKDENLRSKYTAMDKRVGEMDLTRTVAGTFSAQMKVIRKNQLAMADRIMSTIVNSIGAWKSRIAMTRSMEADADMRNAALTDSIEELLKLQREGKTYLNEV